MCVDGKALPSEVKTVIVIFLVLVNWRGRERYMKGSKVTETLSHTGQTKVDLYCPCEFVTQPQLRSNHTSMKLVNQF